MNTPSINQIVLSGTLSGGFREADVGDSHVVEIDLAYTQPAKDGTKESWVQLQAWGNVGDGLARIPEGSEVIVSGSLNRRSWKDKDDEWQHRYSIRVLQIQELAPMELASTGAVDDDIPFS